MWTSVAGRRDRFFFESCWVIQSIRVHMRDRRSLDSRQLFAFREEDCEVARESIGIFPVG
jgi:hypothetical protein